MKSEKGITLAILILTVIVLVILTATIATNSNEFLNISGITKLNNDIEALEDRVASYYVKNNDIPKYGSAMSRSQVNISDLSSNDGDTYYVIDLEKIDNPTLNYGKEYKNATSSDKYIINDVTHNIYYVRGIVYEGETHYTAING